ncbi:MAG: DNA polymerase II [Desulfurococcales archaeon]|nr:DNA polymerase II [Desulfurococcales archaeon]
MRVSFQLLDVTYEVQGREPRIIIYSRLEDGRRAVLVYEGFRPYFYALLERGFDPDEVASRIRRLSKPTSPIVDVELVERRYYGRPVKALKITTLIPQMVRTYRDQVAEVPGVREVLEADIRFVMRFMIDKNLYPMRWYTAEVEELRSLPGFRVDAFYRITGDIVEDESKINIDPLTGLRVTAFDIEVYNPKRTPDPKKDPIIIIGVIDSGDKEPSMITASDHNDIQVISSFIKEINRRDPDIIVGYNQNKFDWPYLIERAKIHGIRLDVGRRTGVPPQTSTYGHISIAGRLNVDLYDFAESIHEVKLKSLEEVAEYLGVMRKSERTMIEWWEIAKYWDNPALRKKLIEYTRDDVVSTILLAEKLLPGGAQLSLISGLPLDQVMAASAGFRLEWRLMREAYKLGELVPNRIQRGEESYVGAIVFKPEPGIHSNIALLDFSSMYPNIMIKYNIGPDTLVRPGEDFDPNQVYIAPETGHRFRKEPPGFFKMILEKLLEMRKRVRKEMKKYKPGTPEYRILDERQKAIKLLANATYGYMGWPAARWYCRECAEAVTSWGRSLIKTAASIARELGLKVVYGDTDSLFVEYDRSRVEKLIERIEDELGFEIKLEKVYKRIFFTEAKKRYVGITEDGRVDVVGFEAIRGDWSELAKDTQIRVAEIVLKTGDVEKAIDYVRRVISELRRGRVPLDKLIIWKTLTKRPEAYEAEQPHVNAARIMMRMGFKVEPGMKIGFIVTRGSGPISKRAKPYFMVKPDEVDIDYYVDKQVTQAALRILGYLGVTEKRLKTAGRQTSLLDFLGG